MGKPKTHVIVVGDGADRALVTVTADPAAAQLYLDHLDKEACDQARRAMNLPPADDNTNCLECPTGGECGLVG